MKRFDGHAFTIQQGISRDKWDFGTKVMYGLEIGDNKDHPTLGQMNRHFERVGGFCAPQSDMVS
jgi:hypothetical protein